jgi:6,7-dimethyl-8-ribityllumazine synthase
MAGTLKSVSGKSAKNLNSKKFAIVVAEWNEEITEAMYQGALNGLTVAGVKRANVITTKVPGTFELPLGALRLAERRDVAAVICIGCVIQGETPHFDYICQGATLGIMEVGLKTKKPVIFGVLTTLTRQQAMDRAGGKYGNKGEEAAHTAVQMLS